MEGNLHIYSVIGHRDAMTRYDVFNDKTGCNFTNNEHVFGHNWTKPDNFPTVLLHSNQHK